MHRKERGGPRGGAIIEMTSAVKVQNGALAWRKFDIPPLSER